MTFMVIFKTLRELWLDLKFIGKILLSPLFLIGVIAMGIMGVLAFFVVDIPVFILESLSKNGSVKELWNFWVK